MAYRNENVTSLIFSKIKVQSPYELQTNVMYKKSFNSLKKCMLVKLRYFKTCTAQQIKRIRLRKFKNANGLNLQILGHL